MNQNISYANNRRTISGRCVWPKCAAEKISYDMPICDGHRRLVGISFMAENVRVAREVMEQAPPPEPAPPRPSFVYYVRIGDHVKIGFTTRLRQRLSDLRVDHENLLAVEPGGRELETQRHREFAAERVGKRENFNPSPRLLAHIKALSIAHQAAA